MQAVALHGMIQRSAAVMTATMSLFFKTAYNLADQARKSEATSFLKRIVRPWGVRRKDVFQQFS